MDKLVVGARGLGLALTPTHLAAFHHYYGALVQWNRRMNLTTIVEQEEVQTRHFLDSLTVLKALPGAIAPLRLIDVGSGAGFPGIPLKVVCPSLQVTLLEATGKKARFLEHIVLLLGLEDVRVVWGRAEEVGHRPDHRERYDVAVARAVAPMAALAELLVPLCRPGGLAIAQKKGEIEAELKEATFAIGTLGGKMESALPISVPELGQDQRMLVLVRKVKTTPAQYPRRPGMPQKRPLTAA